MNMKQHILMALSEKRREWEDLLASLSEEQITAARPPAHWSIKDVIGHLWAWQQRSIARVEAAAQDRAPVFPQWLAALDPERLDSTEQINAWVYESQRDQPWPTIYSQWQAGFQRFLDLAAATSEKDLLDAGRYAWLGGHPLAFVLLASYDHHQEHIEEVSRWLQARQPPVP